MAEVLQHPPDAALSVVELDSTPRALRAGDRDRIGLVVEAAAPEVEPLTGGSLELPSPVSHSGADVETRDRARVNWGRGMSRRLRRSSPPAARSGREARGPRRRRAAVEGLPTHVLRRAAPDARPGCPGLDLHRRARAGPWVR